MKNFVVNFFATRDYEELPALMEQQAMKSAETGNSMYSPHGGYRDPATGRKRGKQPVGKADKYNRKMLEK